jgi:tryptophanyl-tRNA synthetase
MQDVFDVPLVIQLTGELSCNSVALFINSLTDDEKFLFKHELKAEQTMAFSKQNARDIIAVGFNLEKTFIFSNFEYVGGPFYHNVVKISRQITFSQAKATFGFHDSYVTYILLSCYLSCPEITSAKFTLHLFRQPLLSPTPSLKSSALCQTSPA